MNEEGVTIRSYPTPDTDRWWLTTCGDGFGSSDGDGMSAGEMFYAVNLSFYVSLMEQELTFFSGISP